MARTVRSIRPEAPAKRSAPRLRAGQLATARLFVAEGARVHLAGLGKDKLAGAAGVLGADRAGWSVTDVTREEQVAAALAQAAGRFGRLDVLSATRVNAVIP